MVNTFCELWAGAAEHYTDHPVMISAEDKSIFGYQDVDILVSATLSLLHDLGLRQGDRIIVHADNHPEYLFVLWASLQLGLVVVPVDFSASRSTLNAIMDEVGPSLLCCDVKRLSRFEGKATPVLIFDTQKEDDFSDSRVFSTQIADFVDAPVPLLPQLDGTEPAVILFTSGSTGSPKGVMLSQGALCRSGNLMSHAYGWCDQDTLLGLGALHVMSGLRNQATAAVLSGATIIIAASQHRTFAPAVAELCRQHKVTVITAVPAFLHDLITEQQRWQPSLLDTVRMIMVTGAGLDEKSATKVAGLIDTAVLNYYGLTETCGLCCYVPLHHPQQGGGVIGVTVGAEAVVVDENDMPVEDGETGELLIRSDNLMLGYMSRPELTDKVLRNGWFHTGDLVQRRDDGMLYLNGRRNDRIKSRGGEIVYPDEVARSIQQHKAVINAAICTVETSRLQQEMIAFIVVEKNKSGEHALHGELREWLQTRMGAAMIPDRMQFCATLPVNASGKVDKRKLIQEYLSEDASG